MIAASEAVKWSSLYSLVSVWHLRPNHMLSSAARRPSFRSGRHTTSGSSQHTAHLLQSAL